MSQIPVNLQVAWESGEGGLGANAHAEYIYILYAGSVDDEFLCDGLMANLVPLYDESGRVFKSFRHKRLSFGVFKYFIEYVSPQEHRPTGGGSASAGSGQPSADNDASWAYGGSFQFQLGGGSIHIKAAISTKSYGQTSGTNPINNNLIGYNQDTGKADGLDIDDASFDFATAFFLPNDQMTTAYMEQLKLARRCVNSDNVTLVVAGVSQQFLPGELRFRGASGTHRIGTGDFALNLQWSVKGNLTVTYFAEAVDPATGTAYTFNENQPFIVNGWDYMEVIDAPCTDILTGMPTSHAVQINVHQVYPYVPLTPLIPSPSVMSLPESQQQ